MLAPKLRRAILSLPATSSLLPSSMASTRAISSSESESEDEAVHPALKWSASRNNSYGYCQKKYWYQYYGNSLPSVPPELRQYLSFMRNIPTYSSVKGQIVHKLVEEAVRDSLEAKQEVPFLDIAIKAEPLIKELAVVVRQMEGAFPELRGAFDAFRNSRSNIPHTADEMKQQVIMCLKHFHDQRILSRSIASAAEGAIVSPEHDFSHLMSIDSQNKNRVLMRGTADLMFRHTDGTLELLEYKTGNPHPSHELQVKAYALMGQHVYRDSSAISTRSVYLMFPTPPEISYQPYSKTHVTERVRRSILTMLSHVERHDPVTNVAGPDTFKYDEQRRRCENCFHQQICKLANFQPTPLDRLTVSAKPFINRKYPELPEILHHKSPAAVTTTSEDFVPTGPAVAPKPHPSQVEALNRLEKLLMGSTGGAPLAPAAAARKLSLSLTRRRANAAAATAAAAAAGASTSTTTTPSKTTIHGFPPTLASSAAAAPSSRPFVNVGLKNSLSSSSASTSSSPPPPPPPPPPPGASVATGGGGGATVGQQMFVGGSTA